MHPLTFIGIAVAVSILVFGLWYAGDCIYRAGQRKGSHNTSLMWKRLVLDMSYAEYRITDPKNGIADWVWKDRKDVLALLEKELNPKKSPNI